LLKSGYLCIPQIENFILKGKITYRYYTTKREKTEPIVIGVVDFVSFERKFKPS
jgi:uncharacterized protein YhhL (DUF1145 family)